MGARSTYVMTAFVISTIGAVALSGCTAGEPVPTRTVTVSATPRALAPGDTDVSAAAVCGQVSAVETITFNAADAHQRGALGDEAYRSRLDAARFVYERLPSVGDVGASVAELQTWWLTDHPADGSALALDPDDAELQDAIQSVGAACSAVGSPVSISAASGG
ncbi:hypothetical protein [Curtobacterium sp. MCBD17_021]|uniref:hypothetical protein n=1 Tax=Curtobacterium sp. MCBD17_021 TaxID=2175665 RepID=UPI000DA8CBA3|nr:hypothetical protein [Curtobacterium sp. MCBD17_021]PZE63579.1 hypothetical protein DEI83_14095 [Curtobacterium sp. MCBD17_021]